MILPRTPELNILTKVGDRVLAGASVLARWNDTN